MDWNKWTELLGNEFSAVSENRPNLFTLLKLEDTDLNWGDAFGKMEQKHAPKVEAAIRKFAKTGKWPKMSSIVAALLDERLDYGIGLSQEMGWCAEELGMNAPYGVKTDEETICWFLIDAWEEFGFEEVETNLMRVPCLETTATKELKKALWKGKNIIHPDRN
ncbi:MAG: hypothetical protein JWM68_3916 [Verrucomicrobiales bacterium]|nr:hypothetical protein [Verrucomicrobiales bacterium]